ncbi:hypothetical protein PAECIP111802_06878 [Paenibacillus allorhizosphaerae]|uniref:DNRLRE domain-containing protein n=1 Tax=Paenibacillus allorhizosphaerae TaxID=2849866 RepID=A0ABM8VTQ4_9BACL|nr:hypothetical protein PAECIP111802_06878 [Paenibacillus allorhizosphaerae]
MGDTLSTGVLTREPLTISAVVNIANLDKDNANWVTVEILDWSNYSNPVNLPVLIGENEPVIFPYSLGAQQLAVMYADLDHNVSLYEIRITSSKEKNIIANSFGRSVPPYFSQEGIPFTINSRLRWNCKTRSTFTQAATADLSPYFHTASAFDRTGGRACFLRRQAVNFFSFSCPVMDIWAESHKHFAKNGLVPTTILSIYATFCLLLPPFPTIFTLSSHGIK